MGLAVLSNLSKSNDLRILLEVLFMQAVELCPGLLIPVGELYDIRKQVETLRS